MMKMSRSNYTDDLDNWELIKWRGQVASAIRGKRGQALLRDLLAALDAMPAKRLIAYEFEDEGEHCALGALGFARGMDLTDLDPADSDMVAVAFNIAAPLAREIMFMNDDYPRHTPEKRWQIVRQWVEEQIR